MHDPGLRIQEYWELIRQRKVTGMFGLKNGIYLSLQLTQFRREVVLVRERLDARQDAGPRV
jgi:serine/threonine protein kinase HipA of HipAB toxin-antitoxin module